jgi:hypothetical protein
MRTVSTRPGWPALTMLPAGSVTGKTFRSSMRSRMMSASLPLYHFMTDTIGSHAHITTVDVTPILTGVKRTGLVPPGQPVTA